MTDGGTTPPCALTAFGAQLGLPTPVLHRMHIDYEGDPPANGVTNGAIIVSRPPVNSNVLGAILQFGFPGAPGTQAPLVLPSGMEVWTVSSPVLFTYGVQPNASFRFNLQPFVAPNLTFTVQLVCLLNTPIPAGNPAAGIPCAGTATEAASPALWINY